PSQPSTITGNTPVCQGSSQTYSVTNVAGVTYTWTFPTGWVQTDGGNTNSVTVTVGSGSGNVQVTPSNVCGDGTTRTKAVTVESAPQISNQPLKIVTVPGGGGAFSVTSTGATSYTWKVSTNGFAGPYTDISAAGSNPTYSNWTTAVLGITNAQPANNGWIYKCKLTNTCGDITSDTASLIVEETIAPLIINDILVDDDTICLGDSIHLDLVISGGVPPYSYTWSGVGLSSTTIKNPAALPGALGSTTYSVTVTDGTNTQDTSITVFVSGYPTADAGDDKIIGCGTPFTTIGTTAVAGLTYSWEPAADLSNPNAAEPTAMPSATTIYTLTVTNAAGCTDSDEMTVNLITAITVNAGNDTTICAGQEYQLQAVSDYALTFNWTPATGLNYTNINNPVANPEITTTYIITTTAGSCSASDDITITVINMGLTLTYDCNSTMATALPVGLPSYEFSLNDGVVQGESTLNTYYSSSIANNDIISVIAQDESGCIDTVYLTVDCIVELPSAFTPDGDGINDKFPTKYHLPFVLSIFDRWGLLLYYGEEGWDGKHDGKTMSPATYFYKIIITNTDGSKTERTGAVTLVKK
ncbi:MAG: gliding motility-associated C-terminal domain-containing protein, partial [Bacteroidales bacterium]|nr:gliding motility-associated C-terminal domain-containing protein [Bacteroidales bacterium]MDD4214494.1 gliding motility-associated C-terminal domain-containing protein [Bacteroidales bacterium]